VASVKPASRTDAKTTGDSPSVSNDITFLFIVPTGWTERLA